MKENDVIALLELMRVPGLGPVRLRTLVSAFQRPSHIFKASVGELCGPGRIDMGLAQRILKREPTSFPEEQMKKAGKLGVQIITFWDKPYPLLLKKIYDPPVLLFAKGISGEPDTDGVAIVGTRNPTAYGRVVAKNLARELASSGLTIVSGFAKGVDTAAHEAALSVDGRTIAVLGSGLDVIYPATNRRLVPEVAKRGALISEFPFGTRPEAGNFPRRNRIISGMCHGTIVVEAGNRSGAVLTALNAVDQNREVFAVPGRLTDTQSVGCLRLIRMGAVPVDDVRQIVEVLNPKLSHPVKPVQRELKLDLTSEETLIYSGLSDEPRHVDEIVEATKLDPSVVLTVLLGLELKGAVTQLSGKQFVRS